jgi:allene oxide cyclase-like protein
VRTRFGLRVAVLAIVALGVLALGSTSALAHGKSKTLRLVGVVSQLNPVDVDPVGDSVGDRLVFSETLFRRGREVGMSGVDCVAVEVTPPYGVTTLQCVATLSLRRGQITLQGLIEVQGADDPGPWTVAITGGTGAFRGASGQARVRRVSDTRTVYRLRLDSRKHKHGKHRH